MKIYLARQPIYTKSKSLYGYELLYRNSEQNFFPDVNADLATRELSYNVLSEFDFSALTGGHMGLINFTKEALASDLPMLFHPSNLVIEILENVMLDDTLEERLRYLKSENYILALDDFVDDGTYDSIIPLVDIIKVEYGLLTAAKRREIGQKYKASKQLIAERIETEEDFKSALHDGYTLFQGYFFSRPTVLSKSTMNIASSSYTQLWREASKESPDFDVLADIIKADVALTYKLFRLINTPLFYRGNRIASIKQALILLGIKETKRWIMLLLLRDFSKQENDQITKQALTRAVFMEKLFDGMSQSSLAQTAYMVGLFSCLEVLMGEENALSALASLEVGPEISEALFKKEGILHQALNCIQCYEKQQWSTVEAFASAQHLDEQLIPSLYVQALSYADEIFAAQQATPEDKTD